MAQEPKTPPLRVKPRGKAIRWTDADIDKMTTGEGLQKLIEGAQKSVAETGTRALNKLLNSTEIK